MFQRFAAKGPTLFLGALTVLLTASTVPARAVRPNARAAGSVALRSSHRVLAPARHGGGIRATAPIVSKAPVKGTGGSVSGTVSSSTASTQAVPGRNAGWAFHQRVVELAAARAKTKKDKANGPVALAAGPNDFDLDIGNHADEDPTQRLANNIEPQFIPSTTSYVLSSQRGYFDRYGLLQKSDNYPAQGAQLEPQNLVGPDYHIYLSTNLTNRQPVNLEPQPEDRGEEFEPTVVQGPGQLNTNSGRLAYSAFLSNSGANPNDIYNPTATPAWAEPGMATRVIRISDDALNLGATSIKETLIPEVWDTRDVPADPNDPNSTGGKAPRFVPDCTPEWYPIDQNQIVFVSLRGYKKDDASTHYTALYAFTPGGNPQDTPHLVYRVPGKSILFPKFSPDGKYLAFTVADISFDPDANGEIPDPIYDIDITKAALNNPQNPVFMKSAEIWISSVVNPTTLRFPDPVREPTLYGPHRITTFNVNGNEPRDIMPFWSATGQLGFSSDRMDTNADGVADALPADLSTSSFSIYTFPLPFNENYVEDVTVPGLTPVRQTLGPNPAQDTSNELKGSWAPPNPLAVGTQGNQPTVIYQSDAYLATDPTKPTVTYPVWDIWLTDKSNLTGAGTVPQPVADLLVGVPVVTGNPNLSADVKDQLLRTHRIGLPADMVNIAVQVNAGKIQTSPDGLLRTHVFAILKDPDHVTWDTSLREPVNGTLTVNTNPETGMQTAIPNAADVDAFNRTFKGKPNPPSIGDRVELQPVNGQPGWYAVNWFTPVEASDFLMDIEVDEPDGTAYLADNIGGFSTQPFAPSSKCLLVSDFAAGQKAVGIVSNTSGTGGIGTESYFTYRPHPLVATDQSSSYPVVSFNGGFSGSFAVPTPEELAAFGQFNVLGPRASWQDVVLTNNTTTGRVDVLTGSGIADDPLAVALSPFLNRYDLWRTQCREPIALDDIRDNNGNIVQYGVLKNYLPYTQTKVPYLVNTPLPPDPDGPQTARTQVVADRAVLWFAPHAAQLNGNAGQNSKIGYINNWGVGTLARAGTDLQRDTQNVLVNFIGRGGRIMIEGDDAAFALANDNPHAANNPLLAAMHVAFHSHYANDVVAVYNFDRTRLIHARDNGPGTDPIPYATWHVHYPALPNGENFPSGDSDGLLTLAPYTDTFGFWHVRPNNEGTFSDGAWTNEYIDAIVALNPNTNTATNVGTQVVYNFTSPGTTPPEFLPEVGTPVASVSYEAPFTPGPLASNTSASKTLFFSVGIEGLHREYRLSGNPQLAHAKNPLAQIIHNTLDWMTTGGFRGKVTLTNNLSPVSGVIVWAKDDWSAENFVIGQTLGTALTDANGQYQIDGLDSSIYKLFAYKTGYAFQNPVRDAVDSSDDGYTPVDLLLIPVPPGNLKGKVTDKATGDPVAGVTVNITDIQNTVNMTTTSDASGNYQFTNVPAGRYVISVPAFTDPNSGKNYGAVTIDSPPVQVPPSGTATQNIALSENVVPPGTGSLSVTVVDASNSNAPIAGATVDVMQSGSTTPVATNPTDLNGNIVFTDLVTGSYTVKVTPPSTSNFTTPITKSVVIVKDQTTNLQVAFGGIVHTFQPGKVLMASTPYDYAGTASKPGDAARTLGLTTQQAAASIVAYNSTNQSFVFYPTYPADAFHLGKGYGLKLPVAGKITDPGTAYTNTEFMVRLDIGWNLIGTPWDSPVGVPWTTTDTNAKPVMVELRDDPSQGKKTVQDAMTAGWIVSSLWGGTLEEAGAAGEDPNSVWAGTYSAVTTLKPWQGYWVKAAVPLILHVPQPAAAQTTSMASRAAAASLSQAFTPNVDIWGLNIIATAGGLRDNGLGLGFNRRATTGVDAGMDLAKPNPMSETGPVLFTGFSAGPNNVYATDVRGPAATTNWTFFVNTTLSSTPVTLSWTPIGTLPAGTTVTLVDTATGQRTNMSAVNQYTFRTARIGYVRNFRVEVRGSGIR